MFINSQQQCKYTPKSMNCNTPTTKKRIQEHIIQQVRDLDISVALAPYLSITKNGSGYKAICPFHNDSTPSLSISPSKGIYKCFACGEFGTDAINVVMKVKSVEFLDAVRMIADDNKIDIQEEELSPEQEEAIKKREAIFLINKWAADWFAKQLKDEKNENALQYVKSRWNDDSVGDFCIGYAPDEWSSFLTAAKTTGYQNELLLEAGLIGKSEKDGKENTFDTFRNRIMFPIHDHLGRVSGFTGRDISGKEDTAKYKNTKETDTYHKGKILFGLHTAKRSIREKKNAYLVEGNADVIRLHQIGIYNCIATSGGSLSIQQIEELMKITPCITLIPDHDLPKKAGEVPSGEATAIRSAKLIIEHGLFCKIIPLPGGDKKQDPDSFFTDKDQFDLYENGNQGENGHKKDYIFHLAEKEKDGCKDQPDQKARLIADITSLVLSLPVATHEHYLSELGKIMPPKSVWTGKNNKKLIAESSQNNDRKNSLRGGSKNERIEIYLKEKYIFRYNTIKCKSEYKKEKNEDWIPMEKVKLNSLKRELNCVDICSSTENIKSILESDFSPAVDPIKEYFKGLPEWNNVDHISMLCNTITTKNDSLFYKYFRKWIIGVIANALEDDSCKNHLCLVITGEQGKFKTSWLENLCPTALKTHYLYTGKIQPQNKDVLTYLAEYLFINIDDQLRQLNKTDENELKNLITINYVKYRRPYDPFITEYPHLASFMASVNGNDFLTDISGSRRFLPFEALNIKINDAQNINMDLVYSQAYHLYKQNERYWFNDEEIMELHEYNEGFRVVSNEEELVLHYFDIPTSRTKATHFFNTTLIKTKIEQLTGQRLSSKKVGEALTKLKFEKWQRRLENNVREWVWSVIEKTGSRISGENNSDLPF